MTARGWVDLSDMMKIYERKGYVINEQLIRQYLQNPLIAKSFAVYYDLFKKYRSDYQVDAILAGNASEAIEKRAMNAKFDERLSLLGLFMEALGSDFRSIAIAEGMLTILMNDIRGMRASFARCNGMDAANLLTKHAIEIDAKVCTRRRANSMPENDAYANRRAAEVMQKMAKAIREQEAESGMDAFAVAKKLFEKENAHLKTSAKSLRDKLENMFAFCEKVFSEGNEILILVTELTLFPAAARFISRYGCDAYFRHNKNLLFYERKNEIISSIEALNLDD